MKYCTCINLAQMLGAHMLLSRANTACDVVAALFLELAERFVLFLMFEPQACKSLLRHVPTSTLQSPSVGPCDGFQKAYVE